MRYFVLLAMILSVQLSADQIAYAQNNIPGTHCATGNVFRDNPILLTADVMYGQVQSNQVIAGQLLLQNGIAQAKNFAFPNQANVGFRGSLGIALGDNDVHASAVYTRLTSGTTLNDQMVLTGNDEFIFQVPGSQLLGVQGGSFTFYRKQHLRYQTLDILVQAAKFMLGSRTKFQPLVGGRYLHVRQKRVLEVTQLQSSQFGSTLSKLHGIGVFVGTDLRFIVSHAFHFFGNGLVGLIGGTERNSGQGANPASTRTITYSESYNLTLNPYWEVRFGVAASHLLTFGVLASVRIAYELVSIMHTFQQQNSFFTQASGETVGIKVQAGTFGVLLVF